VISRPPATPRRPPERVVWHDVECGAYAADLPLWRELVAAAGGPVLEIGAGTGRVALDLAAHGHEVVAVDHDAQLLAALRARAREHGLSVETVLADARELRLGRRLTLCLVPMQTLQLLGGAAQRRRFWRRARAHLHGGALLAAALTPVLKPFPAQDTTTLPLPEVRELDGWVYSSQPVAVRTGRHAMTIERRRQKVAPAGRLTEHRDVVRLSRLDASTAAAEAVRHGFALEPTRTITPTRDHVGSEVVVLRAE
jgi:SAM-dependent methyltransferase